MTEKERRTVYFKPKITIKKINLNMLFSYNYFEGSEMLAACTWVCGTKGDCLGTTQICVSYCCVSV